MSILEQHSAGGKMAGYLFQPERALYRLAESTVGSLVGIETLDDIVTIDGTGKTIHEQAKHATTDKTILIDTSVELWKTLSIWSNGIKADEIDVSKTDLFIVTNKILPDCLVKTMHLAIKDEDVKECLIELKRVGGTVPKTTERYALEVLAHTDETLTSMIKIIRLSDGSDKNHGKELRDLIISKLHIPSHLPADLIIDGLSGWLHSTILELWRNRKPAWITRESFTNQLYRIQSNLSSKAFRENAKHLIPISDEERQRHEDSLFVKQMNLISADDEELMEAIDDFICCKNEITRLSEEGNITKDDFIKFDRSLKERWSMIFKRYKRQLKTVLASQVESSGIGYEIYSDTINHKETLAGIPTEEYYLTRGRYHHHANMPVLGWHPDYDQLLGLKSKENKNE